jgi:alkaline phosphatase/alkaline phosphatase D
VPAKEFQGKTKAGGYGDFMYQSDWCAGQVLDALDEHGFRDNTLVIFTSDNGPERYAYERVRNFAHRSMGPLRGLKRDIWEGGHRVPLVVRWPGVVPASRVSDALISQLDIMATLAEIVGYKLPQAAAEDSVSQLPLLREDAGRNAVRTALVHNTKPNHYAIREHDWLLIDAKSGTISAVPAWFEQANGYEPNPHAAALYNLRDDPGQRNNLIEDYPGKADEMRHLLAQIQKRGSSSPRHADTGSIAPAGIMVGEVTAHTALAQVRLATTDKLVGGDSPGAAGVVEFAIQPLHAQSIDGRQKLIVHAVPARDFIARASFRDLQPGTRYRCTTRIGADANSLRPGPIAEFKTLPGAEAAERTSFVVVTGMNYAKFHGDDRIDRQQHLLQNNTELPDPYAGSDKHLGYPALVSIMKLKPDFFVGTGDNVYYDTPSKGRAKTADEMRKKWHEQFIQPRFRDLFAVVPTYWEIDDHDYRVDDCDNSGDYDPSPELGRQIMLEQLPVAPADDDDAKTFRTHRISRDLQIWLPENRMYRSPNKMPDGPQKTIWGAEQKAWLKQTLDESNATFKLLLSPTPMIGPDDLRKTDNHADIGGFRHERDEFFGWLKQTGLGAKNFYIICGDRHWQYHAIDPSGIEEFSCGALVDENSRLGRKAGDPQSTDPEGLIKQPYLQSPRSGGFLLVEVAPAQQQQAAKLTFVFHDEHGKVLYKHVK